jgi:hypothetical protein
MQRDDLVEQALDTLPRDLDETYIRIVQRIEHRMPAMRDLALKALMWILYAKRPLTTVEFQYALATERAFRTKTDIGPDSVDIILEACGNLVVLENGTVRPTHYSVQEFFTQPRSETLQEPIRRSLVDSCLVHETLACVCLKYMQLEKLDAPCQYPDELHRRQTDKTFAWYATLYFDYHIHKATTLSPELLGLVEDLFKQSGSSLAAILQMREYGRNSDIGAIFGHFNAVKYPVVASTIVLGTQLFEIDKIKTRWLGNTAPKYALHQASRIGSLNAVIWLLDLEIQVDEQDGKGISPIYYAAMEGHTEVVAFLCERHANVSAQGGYYGNALQAACAGGHSAIVKLLFSKDADVSVQGGHYGNALQAACAKGHSAIVKLLLSKDANVNAEGDYGNALQVACAGGHSAIVELLLSKDADVNAQGGRYDNALQAARRYDNTDIVELLLSKCAAD